MSMVKRMTKGWRAVAALAMSAALTAGGVAYVQPADAYTEVGKGYVTEDHSIFMYIGVRSMHWLKWKLNDGCERESTGPWAAAFSPSRADAHGQPIVDFSAYWGTY